MTVSGLRFIIDRATGIPAYLQIAEQARAGIQAGWVGVGDRLPPVSEVVEVSAVNPNTVLKAYRELEHQGWVYVRQGIGTVVIDRPRPNGDVLAEFAEGIVSAIEQARAKGLSFDDIRTAFNGAILEMQGVRGHAVNRG
ncbi:MAG: GntR family transcriptional regulator [Ferrimicrobium sp.]